jgi:hypothetical protein
MKAIAQFFTVIFHPLFLLNFGMFAVFKFHPYYISKFYDEQFYTISMFIAVNTLIMPLLSVYLLKRFKFIDDFAISNPKQRLIPYSLIAILLSVTTFQMYRYEVYGVPLVFLLSTVVCVILNVLINIKMKVSSHAIASGGLVALFVFLTLFKHLSIFNWFLIASILMAGFSAWSRLKLNAHTDTQVYSGFFIGLLCVLPLLIFFA